MKREVFVVAGAIIKDNKVFAAQRGDRGETRFKWEFPGGKLEVGETPEQALARELKEELKIDVKVHELITKIIDEYETQILHIDTYRCELVGGTPTLTEHLNMAWSDKNDLDKLDFSKADAPTLEKIKRIYLK
ncbi:MAG: (deoxy)nucleoside triphosphate pyrophosphohydrolase [Bacilli bacterium]|nr:(deoxy)nucleoside triphosphate pyrophosphohydrolase [Bacilli bacterium]